MNLRQLWIQRRKDRELAHWARTHDLYIQDADGHRQIQMTFEELAAGSATSDSRMLTSGVHIIARKPGTRIIDWHGQADPRRGA